MIKAVIFDMDGLLLDSQPAWNRADRVFLGKRGFQYTKELQDAVTGSGIKESVQTYMQLGVKGEIDNLIRERQELFYQEFFKDPQLMPGVKKFLHELSKHNLLLAIATGGHRIEKLTTILEAEDILHYFSVLVTSYQVVEKGKPHPDIYLLTAKKLHVDANACIVLEDAVNGVKAGVAAEMKVYGVNPDNTILALLKQVGAYKVFRRIDTIPMQDILL